MAILKHIANKNSNYNKALEYLMFQHNEYTQKPLRDMHGNMLLRDEYYLDGLNCNPYTFSKECDQVNASFCKNSSEREIKSHHYIISFDPLDQIESGLTGAKAQELGLEFAKKYFAGHQALVCTHTDGHNESGNIHVHIILNSIRKNDIEPADFTERPCDSRAGFKHHLTDKLLNHMQQTLMDICRREHLHQVDLLSPAADKVSDREYRKSQRDENKSRFQSEKDYLREAIREVSLYAHSPEEFGVELKRHYNIEFKISRGRYSYLHPDRQKYMTGRTLGNDYTESYLIPLFDGNKKAGRTREQMREDRQTLTTEHVSNATTNDVDAVNRPEYDPSYDYIANPVAVLHFRTKLKLVVDLQNCAKVQASHTYARKVKLSNLQEMAKTICYVQENGFDSIDDINKEYEANLIALDRISASIEATESNISVTRHNFNDSSVHIDRLAFLNESRKMLNANRKAIQDYIKELKVILNNVNALLQTSNITEQKLSHGKSRDFLL